MLVAIKHPLFASSGACVLPTSLSRGPFFGQPKIHHPSQWRQLVWHFAWLCVLHAFTWVVLISMLQYFFIEAMHFFSKTGRHQYNQSLDGTYITWHIPCNKTNRKIEHPLENEICMSNFLVFRHHHFSLPLVVLLVCYLRVGRFQFPHETPMGTKNLGGNWKTPNYGNRKT